MSATGLEVFDTTIQKTHVWLNEIDQELGLGTRRSYEALRAVLFALRDRMPIEEAFHMSAQLPMLVRGIFWEGYRPAGKPESYRSRDEFLAAVEERLPVGEFSGASDCVRAVFGVLQRQLTETELEKVKQVLPQPLQQLFPG